MFENGIEEKHWPCDFFLSKFRTNKDIRRGEGGGGRGTLLREKCFHIYISVQFKRRKTKTFLEAQLKSEQKLKILDTDLITIKIWSYYKYGSCDKWILEQVEKQKHTKTWAYHQKQEKIKKPMSIAAKANKVCKSIKKPMSIQWKTRKDQIPERNFLPWFIIRWFLHNPFLFLFCKQNMESDWGLKVKTDCLWSFFKVPFQIMIIWWCVLFL